MRDRRKDGLLIESLAYNYLLNNFEKVDWISKKKPNAPYDFIVYDKGNELKIDAKSCLFKKVFISNEKYEKINSGSLGDYYFLLMIKKNNFILLSWKDLLDNDDIKIINHPGNMGVTISMYLTNEEYELYSKDKYEINKKIREAVDKEFERLKGLTFKTSSKPVNTSVLEDSVEDRIHGNNAKNKARMQSDKAISAKVRNK